EISMKTIALGIGVFALATATLEAQFNPCVAHSESYCAPPPSISFTPVTPNPITSPVCGTVLAGTIIPPHHGTELVTGRDESCYSETVLAGHNSPTVLSTWTVVDWNGQRTTNAGLSASFTPANPGSGAIIFYAKYTRPNPCPNTLTATYSVPVIITNAGPL